MCMRSSKLALTSYETSALMAASERDSPYRMILLCSAKLTYRIYLVLLHAKWFLIALAVSQHKQRSFMRLQLSCWRLERLDKTKETWNPRPCSCAVNRCSISLRVQRLLRSVEILLLPFFGTLADLVLCCSWEMPNISTFNYNVTCIPRCVGWVAGCQPYKW